MRSHSILNALACLTVCAPHAQAHHSFAPHYDPDNIVTISGTVKEFQFRNPHSFVLIESTNAAGETERWNCESHAAALLSRQGYGREMFTVGEELTITGAAGRRNATTCRVYTVTRLDGNNLVLFDGGIPEVPDRPLADNESIFGDWEPVVTATTLRADRIGNAPMGPSPFDAQLTAAGRAAHAEYDQVTDDPSLSCIPASPWRTWAGSPGSPVRLLRFDDRVEIRFEWMDAVREIHLDSNAHPGDVTPTPLGHSIGRMDGDVLVVETAAMSTGILLPHPGVLMSSDARMTERIGIDDATGELRIAWHLEDPTFYISAPIGELTLVPTDINFEPFDCVPAQ